jgi:hypothetical protein
MASNHVAMRAADPSDAEAITQILTSGMQNDPPLQWLLPDGTGFRSPRWRPARPGNGRSKLHR